MKSSSLLKISTVGVIVVTLTACSIFRGPRPIDPNDDAQFENLPPAPAVEAITPTPAPSTSVAENVAETPEVGAANLENSISGAAIETVPMTAAEATTTSGLTSDLLKIRVFYFDTDNSEVKTLSFGGLNAHAKYLIDHPNARLQLSGHTDERGTREYNLALGERRANSVASYLVVSGVRAEQLSVVSYGKEKPVAEGSNEEAWAQNRRVELDYVTANPN